MELTADVREVILTGVEALKGPAVRRFKAAIVRKLGRGGQRQAEQELGWNREAIRKGEHELRTGIECVDGRSGKRTGVHDRLPNLKADMKDIVDCWSQTDPRFRTTRRYARLTVSQVVKGLIRDKGYQDKELPSNETIRQVMHGLGFKLQKVQKAKPKESSLKPTRSSANFTK
jgi:hypothetical protein